MKEIDKLLDYQEKSLVKVKKQEQLLLGSAEEANKYNTLKKAFNWDDTDNVIHKDLRHSHELAAAIAENVDSKVLTTEALFNYCLENNYVICPVTEYKGRIPEQMLKELKEYCDKNNVNLNSDAIVADFFILCPFSDINGDNDDLKRSKRYKKGIEPKVILLERILKGQKYTTDHYKIITELGKNTPIKNAIRGLYMTHTKTTNFLLSMMVVGGITVLGLIILILAATFGTEDGHSFFEGPWSFFIFLTTCMLIGKTIVPQIGTLRDGPMFSIFNDNGYSEVFNRRQHYMCVGVNSPERNYLTSYIYDKFQYVFPKNKLRIRNHIMFWIHIGLYVALTTSMVHMSRVIALGKVGKPIVIKVDEKDVHDPVKPCQKISYYEVYKKTSPINYTKEYKQIKETAK